MWKAFILETVCSNFQSRKPMATETVFRNKQVNLYVLPDFELDVRGFVHHNIIHIKNPTRYNSVSHFYFRFM